MANNTYRTSGGWNMGSLARDVATAWRLLWSPHVPTALKIVLPAAAAVYWLSPIDLLPGLPFDDIALMILALKMFVQLAPDVAKNPSHEQNSTSSSASGNDNPGGGDVVDTTWTVVKD